MNAHKTIKTFLLVSMCFLMLTFPSPKASVAAPECKPKIDISKQVEGPDSRNFPSGSDVTYEITVTNTGNIDLSNVAVTDRLVSSCNRQIGPLAVGETYTYTCEMSDVTQSFTNIAVVQGEAYGKTISDEDPSTVEIVAPEPNIDIRKQEEGPDSRTFSYGSDVTYAITVTNTGDIDLSNVVVTDSLVSSCDRQIGPLAVDETFPYTCEMSDVTQGFTNIAVAEGEASGERVFDEDPSTVEIVAPEPIIDISKQEEGPDSRTFSSGSDVTFAITVTNTGDIDLSNVVVTDSLVSSCDRQIGPLAVDEPFTYTCEMSDVTQGFTNIAVAEGEALGRTLRDEDPSTVEVVESQFQLTIGYEDMKLVGDNDFDYNDWVVSIPIDMQGIYLDEDTISLEEITFNLKPKARGAKVTHEFHIKFDPDTFSSDGVAELTIKDSEDNSTVKPTQGWDFIGSESNDYLINFDSDLNDEHDCSCEAFGDHREGREHNYRRTREGSLFNSPARRYAVLTLKFDTPVEFNLEDYGQHCEGLFFDPYLHVETVAGHYDISKSGGNPERRILCVQDPEWLWPEEQKRIDIAYLNVRWLWGSLFTFPENWYLNNITHCVFDGEPCDLEPIEWNSFFFVPFLIR